MADKALQLHDQKILERVVGFPVAWINEKLRGEVKETLELRQEALKGGLSEQALLRENYLRALAFLNELSRRINNISVEPLEGHDLYALDTELIPYPGMKIIEVAESMPHPIQIEDWKILKPARRRVDPDLAFKVAGRWYSVLHWD